MCIGLGRAHFLSPTGQCKSFDASADGYCRSEGCGIFVLKRLKDALAENDRVYGIIRGISVNHCGNASSITHPHVETQQKLFKSVLTKAQIDPSSIGVVEAHGTGTQAGDAVEIASIESVFGTSDRDVYITSIKANIGHLEAASGAASLAKVLLMLKNKRIPQQPALKQINPRLAAVMSKNMQITTDGADWKQDPNGQPRRAMINNFGAAGSNAAMIVEEHFLNVSGISQVTSRSVYPFRVSARTSKAVMSLCSQYLLSLRASGTHTHLRDVCYTAIARRRQYEHHFTVVCKGLDDLIRKLQEPTITQKQSKHKPIVFVFSGQGGAYHGMGRELLATSPTFRESVDACEQLLRDMGFPSVRRMLLGTCNSEEARDTYMSQTSIFVLQYALAKLWSSFGVEPHCIIGHSLGEYAVMVIAGVLSLADGLRLVATRATLIKELCPRDRTGMLACTLGTKEALRIVSDHHESCPDLQIACQNTTEDSVIAGPMEQLQAFAEVCKGEGRRCKLLDVPFGFHSSALDPILNEFEKVTAAATYSSPNVRVGSTVCGEFLPSHGIDSQYFIRQTRSTVRFAQLLQTIAEDEELVSACFIEIGPSPMTLPMIRRSLNTPGDYEYLGSLSGKEDAWETLSSSLTQLDSEYCAVNWRRVFDGSGARVMDVPSYPLEQTELYVQYREPAKEKPDETKRGESPGTGLLSRRLCGIEKDDTHDITFETNVETLGPYIKGHLVGGVALCPASIYHEMAVEAVTFGRVIEDNVPVITDLTFEGPLVYSDADARIVRLRMDQQPNVHSRKSTSFRFSSYSPKHSDQIKTHCSGHLTLEYTGNVKKHFARKIAMIKRQLSHLESRRDVSDIFHTKILYETIFPRVVLYAPSYRTIQQLTVTDTGLEGHGIFQLPPAAIREGCVLSPTFFDTLLHGAGFIANSRSDSSEAYICVKVETSKILFNEIDQKAKYSIYCSLLDCIENTLVADSYAVAADGTLVAAVEGIHFKKLNLRSFQSHLSLQQMAVNPPKLRPHSVSSSTVCSEDDDEEEISDSASSISTPSVSSKTDISAQGRGLVVRTISEVCGVHPDSCQSSRSLNELGVDSLMSIEICSSLKRHLPGLDMDGSTLMELNTIGKLSEHIEKITDRDQCPKIMSPDQRQTTSRQISPKRTTQAGSLQRNNSRFPEYKQVESRLKEVCGISHASLRPDSTLGSLGLDSLLSLEVRESFKKEFAIDIAAEQLHSDLTVHELFKTVTKSATPALKPGPRQCSPSNVKTQSAKLLLLQKGDKGSVPLVLFHDGSGSFAAYSKLDEVPFPVYGVANPSLGASKAWAPSIEGMAEEYADAIRSKIGGPVIVGGWSFGGILAFEVAQRLGKHVKGVVLIDSPSPIDHAPLPDAVIDYVLQDLDPKSKRTLGVQFRSHAAILSKYNPQQDRSGAKFALLPSQETINTTKLCGVGYPWLEHGSAQAEAILEWESLIRNEVRILPIPGNHFEPFRGENVHTTTEMLIDAYEYVMRS
ncbi:hypothetical protein GQ43DRAFT_442160 [Delitschia confertaspora ATCC 74209]|uniref:Polyketide synthase n=1 Tax=Delitschia confertaspora ATCC 74209 TaxID=1513339 RepID=A0A9P4JNN6_9PLEO|nr:hypothetical protein GQ43DRAFT_442160 [Delitschia confertaspora ATCC 74209]